MIRIPLYLAVAQWALLAAMGILVLVLFRQLGRLMSGGGGSRQPGPVAGTLAQPLAYSRPGEDMVRHWTPGSGQPSMLAFVDPTCPSCEQLVSLLDEALAAGQLDGVRTLLLISDPAAYLRISQPFQRTQLEIGRPARPAGLDFYQVTATPLLVAIDGSGVVRAAGPVHQAADIRSFAASAVAAVAAAVPTSGG